MRHSAAWETTISGWASRTEGPGITYHRQVLARRRFRSGSLSSESHKSLASMLQVLKKWEKREGLRAETRAVLQTRVAQVEAESELERGKLYLSAGDFARAFESLKKANSHFRRNKLRVALFGLRVAPHLTSFATAARETLAS